jgi:hypothetical protein
VKSDDVQYEQAGMFFRAAVGALAAVIVTLFLQLRVFDFPFLHTGAADTTSSLRRRSIFLPLQAAL